MNIGDFSIHNCKVFNCSVMTKKKALFAACQKWHKDNPNRGKGDCALCDQYKDNIIPGLMENPHDMEDIYKEECSDCPLCQATGLSCNNANSPWRKWSIAQGMTGNKQDEKEAADRLYEILKKLYDETKEISK